MSRYETHTMKEPGLPFILHDTHHSRAHTDAPGNWHENVEILCFTGGSGTVWSNEQQFSVEAGDLVVLNTNCIHSISCSQEIHYYCLIVDRSFCLENRFDTNQISFVPLLRDAELSSLFEELAAEWTSDAPLPFRVSAIRATVLRIMVILCRRYSRGENSLSGDSHLLSCIKQAIGLIRADCQRELSLDEIASTVGLSKYYFAREFRRITGYTFVSYVNLIRCEKAKRLLAENVETVGEVGRICGFSNSSYFSKTFAKHVGVRPAEYRAVKIGLR